MFLFSGFKNNLVSLNNTSLFLMDPESGFINPEIIFNKVDLPTPL